MNLRFLGEILGTFMGTYKVYGSGVRTHTRGHSFNLTVGFKGDGLMALGFMYFIWGYYCTQYRVSSISSFWDIVFCIRNIIWV